MKEIYMHNGERKEGWMLKMTPLPTEYCTCPFIDLRHFSPAYCETLLTCVGWTEDLFWEIS